MRTVVAEPLTAEAFAPFGQVVAVKASGGHAANQGNATRFDFAANLESDRAHARPNLCAFEATPQALPLPLKLLERHPHSSQAFLPMVVEEYLVCVAPNAADGGPDLTKLRAFIARAGQGINYNKAQWHHPIVALGTPATFSMLAWEDGTRGDCEERPVTERVQVVRATS